MKRASLFDSIFRYPFVSLEKFYGAEFLPGAKYFDRIDDWALYVARIEFLFKGLPCRFEKWSHMSIVVWDWWCL